MGIELESLARKLLIKESPEQIAYEFKRYVNEYNNYILFNWHPLGFVHSKLCNIPNIGDLRLHVWLPGYRNAQLPQMPIHDHIFKVNSFILTGTVTNHIYETGKGSGQLYRTYKAKYNNRGSILIPQEELATCSLKSSTSHSKGDFYIVEKGIFHETTVETHEFAATLVIATEKAEDEHPKILGPIKNHEYFYSREECNEPILKILSERI
jgi:hypothetical protein